MVVCCGRNEMGDASPQQTAYSTKRQKNPKKATPFHSLRIFASALTPFSPLSFFPIVLLLPPLSLPLSLHTFSLSHFKHPSYIHPSPRLPTYLRPPHASNRCFSLSPSSSVGHPCLAVGTLCLLTATTTSAQSAQALPVPLTNMAYATVYERRFMFMGDIMTIRMYPSSTLSN
ncbi:MAG: hypothetical protein J3R72DRAFT_257970 [Linnemannia gamsii]|nr:MAG: hypothetical protein J3R72DRAFT_257970 [Linnemannia gamsii]